MIEPIKPYALLRFPGSSTIEYFDTSSSDWGKKFIFQPFDLISKPLLLKASNQPIQYISIDALETSTVEAMTKEAYIEYIEKTIAFIKAKQMKKMVVSRIQTMEIPKGFNPILFFNTLNHVYPNTCNSCIYDGKSIWIGASPELFLERNNQSISMMSLAGTVSDQLKEDFGNKEKLEQDYVTSYISEHLQNVCEAGSIEIEASRVLSAGPVKHLLNIIHATLLPQIETLTVAHHLHPTPAVAGNPKDISLTYLQQNEPNRSYYTGFLGTLESNFAKLYVNLRCMQIFKNKIVLYAGGGITEASIPEKEWIETELKMDTLRKLLT